MMKLRSLHIFNSICQFGSITEASHHIHISQPAMTQSLSKLESTLGVKLFSRNQRMNMTEVGKLFRKRIRNGMVRLEEAVEETASSRTCNNPGLYRQISDSQLSALHAVLEKNNFKAAAESIGQTTSTVHRNFRSLEELLGQKLADTRPNLIRANAAGETFYTLSKLAMREFRQAQSDIEGWKGNFDEVFTVGALPLVQSSILPRTLLAFAQEFPQVTVIVVDGTYDGMIRQMQRGEIDYIIGALRSGFMPDFITQVPLFDDTLSIVARAGHPIGKLKKITPKDLAAYPWVMPRTASPSRLFFDRFYKSLNRPHYLQCPVETGSFGVLRCILLESDRLGVISAHQAHYELQHNILTKLDYDLEKSTRTIGVTNRTGWFPSPPQSRFLELLQQNCPHSSSHLSRKISRLKC